MALLVAPPLASRAGAQVRYRASRQENFRAQAGPGGTLLGTVMPGAALSGGEPADGWVRVTLEGWIWSRSIEPTARGDFDLTVTADAGENLRTEPNGALRARLREGCLLDELARRPGWVHVRRTGWIWARSLERQGGAGPAPVAGGAGTPALDRATLGIAAPLARTAGGDTVGNLARGTPVRVLGRADGWARVQLELWVPEAAIRPGGEGVLVGVSASELRAAPQEFTGKVLQWRVQVVAREVADELRPDIPRGASYLLVRGPLPETAFAYVVVPEAWLAGVDALEPLAEVVLLGRVLVAGTRYLGNPVLELLDLQPVER